MTTAAEKRVEKLVAQNERKQATIDKLKGTIADMKAKRAAARGAKASPRATGGKRAAPKRRTSRSAQAQASA